MYVLQREPYVFKVIKPRISLSVALKDMELTAATYTPSSPPTPEYQLMLAALTYPSAEKYIKHRLI